MMSSKIRTRDRIPDENPPKPSGNVTTFKTYKPAVQPAKVDNTVVGGSRIRQPIRAINPSRATIGSKGFLSPSRDREIQRIVLEAANHDTLYVEVRELERGIRIELISEKERENSCTITLSLESTDVDRNKIRHSFPMPRLPISIQFIKLPVRDFSESAFSVVGQSLKGKIKESAVVNVLPDVTEEQLSAIVEVNPLAQIQEAERIRRRKFEGKEWTLKGSKSATFLRDLCSPKAIQPISELSKQTTIPFKMNPEQLVKKSIPISPCSHTMPLKPRTQQSRLQLPTKEITLKLEQPSTTTNRTAKDIELGKLKRVTSTQLLKNNKSATNLEVLNKPDTASFKKKVPQPMKLQPQKPSTTMTPMLKSAMSPRTATTASEFSTKTKYAPMSAKLTNKVQGELSVSRMLDFTEGSSSRMEQQLQCGSSRLQ